MLTTEAPIRGTPAPEALRQGSRAGSVVRFFVSVLVSGTLSWRLALVLRRPLEIQTDIIGYTIHADFNSFNYFTQYYITILCFPLLALLLYALIGRLWAGSDWPKPTAVSAPDELPPSVRPWVRILPTFAVGAIPGTAWLMSTEASSDRRLLVPIGTALAYAGLVCGAGLIRACRRGGSAGVVPSLVNIVVAPFTVVLLAVLSSATWVGVVEPPAVERYAPIPPGVVVEVIAAASIWTALRLRRAHDPWRLARLERDSVLLIVVPVLLVVYTAVLTRPLGFVDLFHDGEYVGGANLVSHGAFPWRDILFIHGLFQDVVVPWFGFHTFGRSIWGARAGFDFWATPLWWLAYYALFIYLFRRRPLLLLVALAVPLCGAYPFAHYRFAFYPLILLALAALLRKPGWLQASGLAASLLIGNVLAPELGYATLAAGAVVLFYEWSRKDRGSRLRDRLAGTWRLSLVLAALVLLWCAFLQAHGALLPFINYYQTFIPGHEITGAVRLLPSAFADSYFVELMLLPPVTVVLMFWYVVSRRRQDIALEERDWVMLAATLVTAAYYKKFLSRPDWHITHSTAAALPLVFFLADKGLDAVRTVVPSRARPWVHVLGAVTILALVVHASPPGFLGWQGQLATHYHFRVPKPQTTIAPFGWSDAKIETGLPELARLKSFLQSEMAPEEPIFDFTNSPALYHFLLDLRPASKFFHVSMAIRRRGQEQLIQDLERTRPRLVVFESDGGGLGPWDGIPNVVRHYLVSKYLLDHYEPLAKVAGQTFYVSREQRSRLALRQPAVVSGGEAPTVPGCDWGFAPLHLKMDELTSGPQARIVSKENAVRVEASGWAAAASSAGAAPAKEIVTVSDGRVRSRSPTGGDRPDVARVIAPAARSSGFKLLAEWNQPGERRPNVRILAVGEAGQVGDLEVPGSRTTAAVEPLPAELGSLRLQPGSMLGSVDQFFLSGESILQAEFPPEIPASSLAGLEIEVSASRSGGIAISSVPPEREGTQTRGVLASRGVVLSVPRTAGIRLRVPADNCPSWRDSTSSRLFLRADEGIQVKEIRGLQRSR
jgi:hypothetical protein